MGDYCIRKLAFPFCFFRVGPVSAPGQCLCLISWCWASTRVALIDLISFCIFSFDPSWEVCLCIFIQEIKPCKSTGLTWLEGKWSWSVEGEGEGLNSKEDGPPFYYCMPKCARHQCNKSVTAILPASLPTLFLKENNGSRPQSPKLKWHPSAYHFEWLVGKNAFSHRLLRSQGEFESNMRPQSHAQLDLGQVPRACLQAAADILLLPQNRGSSWLNHVALWWSSHPRKRTLEWRGGYARKASLNLSLQQQKMEPVKLSRERKRIQEKWSHSVL